MKKSHLDKMAKAHPGAFALNLAQRALARNLYKKRDAHPTAWPVNDLVLKRSFSLVRVMTFSMGPNLSGSMPSLAGDTLPLVQVRRIKNERQRSQRYADQILLKFQTGNYASFTPAKPEVDTVETDLVHDVLGTRKNDSSTAGEDGREASPIPASQRANVNQSKRGAKPIMVSLQVYNWFDDYENLNWVK